MQPKQKTGCKVMNIDPKSYRAKAFNKRVRFIVLHYTAGNFADSISALTGMNVSSHYLIPDITDKTYLNAGFNDMRIFNLVDEQDRAWHAGVSAWDNRSNINDTSIGIEIVNEASFHDGKFTFPPFQDSQIDAVISLVTSLLSRYPDVTPINVIGHSDIAPGRKTDPGPRFPWKKLYDKGIGAWYDENTKNEFVKIYKNNLPDKKTIISMLKTYGYNTDTANTDTGFKNLIQSLQLHFRQSDFSGKADVETIAILAALNKKYR